MAGAIVNRRKWRQFRKRFDELRHSPVLTYSNFRLTAPPGRLQTDGHDAGPFHFIGTFESITDRQTLWIRSDNLTVPVSLKKAKSYLLPAADDDEAQTADPRDETIEIIRWNKVSSLTEGARVFAGGLLADTDGRFSFTSTKENPLVVIIFYGSDDSLPARVIRGGRPYGEYLNAVTPYSLMIGAICQILIAADNLGSHGPAFRPTVIGSLIALFIPLYPVIPPGLLFTLLYRRLVWRVRNLRACGDLARYGIAGKSAAGGPSARRFTVKANLLEAAAWIILIAGIGLNIFFLSIFLAVL
jgi:hypothetical protein